MDSVPPEDDTTAVVEDVEFLAPVLISTADTLVVPPAGATAAVPPVITLETEDTYPPVDELTLTTELVPPVPVADDTAVVDAAQTHSLYPEQSARHQR